MIETDIPSNLAAFERRAREKMAAPDWDYLMAGTAPGETGAENVEAWARLKLRPRILRGVAQADTSTTVLGVEVAAPLFIAPNGRATRYCADGEAAVLRAASAQNVGALLASSVSGSIAVLRSLAPGALTWSQFYMTRERNFLRDRAALAAEAGCRALVLTVDLLPDANRMRPPQPARATWEIAPTKEPEPIFTGAGIDDLAWLCAEASLPVIVKGVLRSDDAEDCLSAGAKALIVSNHGGNQLDSAIASAEALKDIVAACGARAEVYVDGGIRSGVDVMKALALGARAVMIGRPISHALAVAGAAGASAYLAILRAELQRAMLLCGAGSTDAIGADWVT